LCFGCELGRGTVLGESLKALGGWKRENISKCLGFLFGRDIPQEAHDSKALSQIQKFLLEWGGEKLSLVGKVLIVNQAILAFSTSTLAKIFQEKFSKRLGD
jgi:hypothetical protein